MQKFGVQRVSAPWFGANIRTDGDAGWLGNTVTWLRTGLRGIKGSEHGSWPLWPSGNEDKTQSGHRKLKTSLDSADKFTVTPIDHRYFGITAFGNTSF